MATNIAPVLLPATDPHILKNTVVIASIQGIIGDPAVPDFHLVNDPDANGIYGIAVLSGPESAAPVTVFYSTTGADTGAIWHQIDLATGALHLLADGNTYIKVVPDQDYSGVISYGSIVAWDGTNGIVNGTYVPVTARGGSTAYSEYVEYPKMYVDEVPIPTSDYLWQYTITLQQAHDFVMANVASPSTIFSISDKFDITTSMLAEIVGGAITSSDVIAYFQSAGYNSDVLNLSVSDYLIKNGSSLQQQYDFIMANVASPAAIYNESKALGLTTDMLANIVGGNFTADDVAAYFTANGLNPVSLDLFT